MANDSNIIDKRAKNVRSIKMAIAAFEFVLIGSFFAAVAYAVFDTKADTLTVFSGTAIGIIVLWIALLVPYLAWSVYFFNIHFGMPPKEREEMLEERKKLMRKFQIDNIMAEDIEAQRKIQGIMSLNGLVIPTANPFAKETMGLPPGTIRGMLALTVTVGGLAMFIASLGMNSSLPGSSFFVDNLEFFKTGYLMVIAFYFGSKSLEVFQKGVDKDVRSSERENGARISENRLSNDTFAAEEDDNTASTLFPEPFDEEEEDGNIV